MEYIKYVYFNFVKKSVILFFYLVFRIDFENDFCFKIC